MKIAQLICPTGFYGAERWILALANNLDPDELRCDIVAISENPAESIEILDCYPQHVGETFRLEMNGRFDYKIINKLCRHINEQRVDIIHTHGYKSDIIGVICAKRCGIKSVSTPHGFGTQLDWKLRLYNRLGCFALRFMDAVVPLSKQLFEDLAKFRIKPEKLKLILNGVDLSGIKKTELSVCDRASKQEKNICYVGRLAAGKEVHEILHMFEQLWSQNNALKLSIVGDGELKNELEQIASNLQSRSHIEFLGFRDDRLELMKSYDLFVMTSRSEGVPRCLMEALAIGIPVVAYSIPGVRQLIINESTGLLAEFGNREELIAQAGRLLNDPELAASVVASGRKHVVDNYSGSRMAREYTALFKNMLEDSEVKG